MQPVLDELAKNHSDKVIVRKVHVDQDPATTKKYEVTSLGTIVYLDCEGKERLREFGFHDAEYVLDRVQEVEEERLKELQGDR
ncbi:MAG: thioredoxin family protein [Planctomycetota bacterium]|nr:thioredoxin family protein [Planctomycetota bacterium]